MKRSEHAILTTHAGSLPRPAELTALLARRARDEAVDEARIEALAGEAVRDVVARQAATGIHVGNDGEQEREGFFLYVRRRMSGFGGRWERPPPADVKRYPQYAQLRAAAMPARPAVSNFAPPRCVGEVRYRDRSAIERECAIFRAALDAAAPALAEPFLTAPSPGIVAAAMHNDWYDSEEAYINALADALRIEYRGIVEHGFLLQLDCPDLALERHVGFQDRPLSKFLAFVETVIEAINRALEGIAPERVRLHVCWGNYEGPHDSDVPLEDILPALLHAKVGALVLPFANPRHAHEVRVLERHPLGDDQILVGGVIDTLTHFVEHPEVVADRIERLAAAVGDPRRVIAGTDCGFDTSAGMGRVAQDVVWAKLAALVEGASLASARIRELGR